MPLPPRKNPVMYRDDRLQEFPQFGREIPYSVDCTCVDLASLCDFILFLGLCGSKNVLEEV